MVRTILACSLVALVAATAGCRTCAGPYDDCGPTFTGGNGCSRCASTARAGSILSSDLGPTGEVVVGTEIFDSMAVELEPTPDDFGSLPSGIAPTPEVPTPEVPTPEPVSHPAPEPDESVKASSAQEPVIDATPPTPAARWTARRPHRVRWR